MQRALQSSVRGVKRELATHDSRSSLAAAHKAAGAAPDRERRAEPQSLLLGSLRYERDAALPLGKRHQRELRYLRREAPQAEK